MNLEKEDTLLYDRINHIIIEYIIIIIVRILMYYEF